MTTVELVPEPLIVPMTPLEPPPFPEIVPNDPSLVGTTNETTVELSEPIGVCTFDVLKSETFRVLPPQPWFEVVAVRFDWLLNPLKVIVSTMKFVWLELQISPTEV